MGDLIQTTADLAASCALAQEAGLLSLDTEFVWRSTYRAQLAIVQLGERKSCWAIDCLAGLAADALRKLVDDPGVVKILHDSRQDLMHLRHWCGASPKNVFDTQLAAAFAGFRSGIGLQTLLFEACGVGLPKTETCTDWTQRPLSDAQVRYALDDVRYLPQLRDELLSRAEALGTRAWLEEELKTLDDPARYVEFDPGEAWRRIRLGRVRLDGLGRAVLRAVVARREALAEQWNLPRGWLGDDGSLVAMAVSGSVGKLRHRLKGGRVDTVRASYAEAIEAAKSLDASEWPDDPHRHYIREVTEAAGAAMEWLVARAGELHVDQAVLASRSTVTAFVDDVGDRSNPLASGWRYEVVGRELAERFGVD